MLDRLQRGPFGLPRDTALFLIASLAVGGLIAARRSGRAIPLEQLGLHDGGEGGGVAARRADRQRGPRHAAHRLRVPRPCLRRRGIRSSAAARCVEGGVKLRDLASAALIADIRQRVTGVAEFSAFAVFDFKSLQAKLAGLEMVTREIKPSVGAKEGLERFLAAWRGSGLTAEDVELLKGFGRFLRAGRGTVRVHQPLSSPHGGGAGGGEGTRACLVARGDQRAYREPASGVLADGGQVLTTLFAHFRERYIAIYGGLHAEFYRAREPVKLSRQAARALGAVRLLASIESLDQAGGPRSIPPMRWSRARRRAAPATSPRSCLRSAGVRLRVPARRPGRERSRRSAPRTRIEKALASFMEALVTPRVREAVAARAFALQDANPGIARRLARACLRACSRGFELGRSPRHA